MEVPGRRRVRPVGTAGWPSMGPTGGTPAGGRCRSSGCCAVTRPAGSGRIRCCRMCWSAAADYLFELARHSEADALVSGDTDVLGVEIPGLDLLTPRQLLDQLTNSLEPGVAGGADGLSHRFECSCVMVRMFMCESTACGASTAPNRGACLVDRTEHIGGLANLSGFVSSVPAKRTAVSGKMAAPYPVGSLGSNPGGRAPRGGTGPVRRGGRRLVARGKRREWSTSWCPPLGIRIGRCRLCCCHRRSRRMCVIAREHPDG